MARRRTDVLVKDSETGMHYRLRRGEVKAELAAHASFKVVPWPPTPKWTRLVRFTQLELCR